MRAFFVLFFLFMFSVSVFGFFDSSKFLIIKRDINLSDINIIGDLNVDGNIDLIGNNSIVFGHPSVSISQDGFNALELRATEGAEVKVISDVFNLMGVVSSVNFGSPILWLSDNLYDVGIYSSRPRNIFLGNDLNAGNDVNVTNILRAPQICLSGDCKSSWPSGSGLDTNTVTAGWTLNDGNWIVDLNTTKNLWVKGYAGIGVASPLAKLDVDAAGALALALKIKGVEDRDVFEWYGYDGIRLGMFGEYGDIILDRGSYYGDGSQLTNLNAPTNTVFNASFPLADGNAPTYVRGAIFNAADMNTYTKITNTFDGNFNRMLAGNVDKNVNAIIALRIPWADVNVSSSGLWMNKTQFDANFNRDNNSAAVWLGSVLGAPTNAVFNAAFPVADANISSAATWNGKASWVQINAVVPWADANVSNDLTINTSNNAIFRGDLNAYGGLHANTIGSADNNAISFQTKDTTIITLTADGNLGIHNTTAHAWLDINGVNSNNNLFRIDAGSNTLIKTILVDKNGNVGIGTATPEYPLHVYTVRNNNMITVSSTASNVGIGKIPNASYMLDVNGAINNNSTISSTGIISTTSVMSTLGIKTTGQGWNIVSEPALFEKTNMVANIAQLAGDAQPSNGYNASGLYIRPTFYEGGAGIVTPLISSGTFRTPVVSNQAGDTNYINTVYIEGETSNIATKNGFYSLWVDAGKSRFDGNVLIGSDSNASIGWFDINGRNHRFLVGLDGNVGIGTTTLNRALNVNDDSNFIGTIYGSRAQFSNTGSAGVSVAGDGLGSSPSYWALSVKDLVGNTIIGFNPSIEANRYGVMGIIGNPSTTTPYVNETTGQINFNNNNLTTSDKTLASIQARRDTNEYKGQLVFTTTYNNDQYGEMARFNMLLNHDGNNYIGGVGNLGGYPAPPSPLSVDGGITVGSLLAGGIIPGTPAPTNGALIQGNVQIMTGGSANKVVCWKADGQTLGYCSSVVDVTGACTCN